MSRASVKVVTIVAEAVLKERLTAAVLDSGASGYTLVEASGLGSRGLRSTTVLDGQNIRIEALVSEVTAERLLALLEREHFPYYAVVAWVVDATVVRGGKFGSTIT